ncbi:unnamed protein product [Lymnaea stagnalis]|uniref:MD-2-related lipid-recognition domain-containing protein n=1 Tax=Lymnaea stagnalis TaxID=6523 RepID=A0AAV2IG54_LYMST
MELSYLNVVTLVFIGTSILPLLNVDGFGFKFNSYKKFIVTQEIKDDSVSDSLSISSNQNDYFDRKTSPSKLKDPFSLGLRSSFIRAFSSQRLGSFSEIKSQKSFVTDDFAWKSCGPENQLVEIRNLTFEPSPLVFPGVMTFGFDVIFHDTINSDASVSAKLALQYRRGSGTWIPIPCIGQIGSCNYTDICALTKGISCPPDLKQKGIPCTCPFNKGEYTLEHYDVEIDAAVFLAGNYQGQINLNDKDKGQIACYIVNFTIG